MGPGSWTEQGKTVSPAAVHLLQLWRQLLSLSKVPHGGQMWWSRDSPWPVISVTLDFSKPHTGWGAPSSSPPAPALAPLPP